MGLGDLLGTKKEETRTINLPDYTAESLALYADQMLGNPVYDKVILDIRNEIMETWKGTHMNDVEGRESLYTTLRLLNLLDTKIRSLVQSAQLKVVSGKTRLTIV